MYIFEFEHTFSRQDLCDMWQGLPPDLGRNMDDFAHSTISHQLLSKELIGELSAISRAFP